MNYALDKYSGYISHHYSKEGRGYFSYENISDEEKLKLYGSPKGRVADFIENYPDIVDYKDGDSFLDAGCGRGQNIKVLLEKFKASKIYGVDLSKEAVDVINLAVQNDNLKAEAADLTNIEIFKAIEDKSYDHIVMSHVFSIIIGNSLEHTKKIRQSIIREFVRIAHKSVLIIDGPENVNEKESFVIEQLHRGAYTESILDYFPQDLGRTIVMKSPYSTAVFFKKNKWPTDKADIDMANAFHGILQAAMPIVKGLPEAVQLILTENVR